MKTLSRQDTEKLGLLLHIIPQEDEWEAFLEDVRFEWSPWKEHLTDLPCCLAILFGGLAFFEYEDNTFWPQFARAVRQERIDPNQQRVIGHAYTAALDHLGLPKVSRKESGTKDYVGTAVFHAGIPVSLWSGFIDLCEWALRNPEWGSLSDADWIEIVDRRAASRQRLKRFLTQNREAASKFIRELLDISKIIREEPKTNLGELLSASILRAEYFEEVPETSDFFGLEDTDKLFPDRPRLIWNDHLGQLAVYLPGIDNSKLPATWQIGTMTQAASSSPIEVKIGSLGFQEHIQVQLHSGNKTEFKLLKGVSPWALFDVERVGRSVNINREQLPLRCYTVIAREPLTVSQIEGFDVSETTCNEAYELSDGTACYVTSLWPSNVRRASLKIGARELSFRTRERIEIRTFVGRAHRAGFFERLPNGRYKLESLPTICLSVPKGYFKSTGEILNTRFKVKLDARIASGRWVQQGGAHGDEWDLFFWENEKKPFMEFKTGTPKLKSFSELASAVRSPNLHGEHTLAVEGVDFRTFQMDIFLDRSKEGMQSCWRKLPGDYLIWFILCQTPDGMKWEDIITARDAIASGQPLSYYTLKKYLDLGFFKRTGWIWTIAESRAVLKEIENGQTVLQYCGSPSILWSLYRQKYIEPTQLSVIEVIDRRGEVPYLEMLWERSLTPLIKKFLKAKRVIIRNELWNL